MLKEHNYKTAITLILLLALSAYFALKAFTTGDDINVYLYAAKHLGNDENIYIGNPYNQYLYSPLFALLLKPLSYLNWNISRFLWTLISIAALYRLWNLFTMVIGTTFDFVTGYRKWLTAGAVILSLGVTVQKLI